MQPQLLCVIIVKCVFLVWDSAKAHLLLLLLRTKQKKKEVAAVGAIFVHQGLLRVQLFIL